MSGLVFNGKLSPEDQIEVEEMIAAMIWEEGEAFDALSEEQCADLGRRILKRVLARFRPDLFEFIDEGDDEEDG